MECFVAKECDIKSKQQVKYDEKEYILIIGVTVNHNHFITFHNNSSSIYFEIDDQETKLDPDKMCVTMIPDNPSQLLDNSTLMLFDHCIMVNHDNVLKIYDIDTLQQVDNILVPQTIKAIKLTNHFIILECHIKKDNKINYHYELFNLHFKHLTTINKQIMFIDNSQYKNNFLVFFDDKITTKLDGKYFLYDAEENVYMKIDDAQFNLDNCVIFSSTYNTYNTYNTPNKLNVFSEKNCLDCSICLDTITEIHALVPCGHTSLCTKCFKQNVIKCPICRKNIEKRIKIYK